MRTIEYKNLVVTNSKKILYKGSTSSNIDMYKYAQKHLTEMNLEDNLNKKIASKYLEFISKKDKLNEKEKTWLINYIAITESIKNNIDFDILKRRTISLPGFIINIGDGIDFGKKSDKLTLGYHKSNDVIAINTTNIKRANEIENDDFSNIALTCYHEITHAIQKNEQKENYPNFRKWMLMTEDLLHVDGCNYYNENYDKSLIECEANAIGYKKTLDLLNKCNKEKYNDVMKKVKSSYQSVDAKSNILVSSEKVKYDLAEKTTIEILDRYIGSTSYKVKEYPMLRFVYDTSGEPKGINELCSNERELVKLYSKIYKQDPALVNDTKYFYDRILWSRISVIDNYEHYSKENIERLEEAVNNTLEDLKRRKKLNDRVNNPYDKKKNELVINKNIEQCYDKLSKLEVKLEKVA